MIQCVCIINNGMVKMVKVSFGSIIKEAWLEILPTAAVSD